MGIFHVFRGKCEVCDCECFLTHFGIGAQRLDLLEPFRSRWIYSSSSVRPASGVWYVLILITSILCTSWPASRSMFCLLHLSSLQSLFGRKCVSGYLPLLSYLVKSSVAWNYHYYVATCQCYCRYCLQFAWCRYVVRNVISGTSCLSLFHRNIKKYTFTHKNTSANHKKKEKLFLSLLRKRAEMLFWNKSGKVGFTSKE